MSHLLILIMPGIDFVVSTPYFDIVQFLTGFATRIIVSDVSLPSLVSQDEKLIQDPRFFFAFRIHNSGIIERLQNSIVFNENLES